MNRLLLALEHGQVSNWGELWKDIFPEAKQLHEVEMKINPENWAPGKNEFYRFMEAAPSIRTLALVDNPLE